MDDYILQGRLLHIHEGLVLVLLEPVDVHPHVLGELGVHVHYRIVPEELQVAVEVGDLSLEVAVKFPSGAVFVHDVVNRILIDLERGGIETARFEDPRHAAEAPPAFVAGVFLGVPELGVQELIDTAVRGVDVPGVGLAAVPDIRLGTARTAAVYIVIWIRFKRSQIFLSVGRNPRGVSGDQTQHLSSIFVKVLSSSKKPSF